jgi:hypothetical protein
MLMKTVALIVVSAFALYGAAHADVSISNKPTQNMSCDAGVCTATAQKAVLNVTDLATMLASGDVKVVPGKLASDIDIVAPLTWASRSRLTLDAYGSILFSQPLTSGKRGGVTIVASDGGKLGDYSFTSGGNVSFPKGQGSLVINGNTYKLEPTLADLANDISGNPAGFFALSADYDASKDGIYDRPPIPTPLQGKFAGMGHTVSNLSIHASSFSKGAGFGLFVENDGVVRDVALVNVNIFGKGKFAYIGGVVGINNGRISAVSVSGVVGGAGGLPNIGGMVGFNTGLIADSLANVTLNGGKKSFVGGIAGASYSGNLHSTNSQGGSEIAVLNSVAHGRINGDIVAGGLIGTTNTSEISLSYSDATVVSNGWAGGLVALNDGAIDQSYSTGTVTGSPTWTTSTGGLAAENKSDIGQMGVVTNSYARGNVTAVGGAAGGLSGANRGSISSAYSTGAVSGSPAGGSIGSQKAGDMSASYWDLNTSGIGDSSQGCGDVPNCPGVTGLTTAQLTSGLPSGFDPNIWGQSASVNNGYPYLLALPPGGDTAMKRRIASIAEEKFVPHHVTAAMKRKAVETMLSKYAQYRMARGSRVP